MKRNLRYFVIFPGISVIAVIFYLLYFFTVPSIVNIEKYKPELKKYFKENISVPVDIGKLKVEMTWNLGVRVQTDKIILKKKDGSKFVNTGSSYIEVALLPLLAKRTEIREIVVNNPDLTVTRFKDGTFDIAKILLKKGKSKYKVELKNTSIYLNNYKLDFHDEYLSPEKRFLCEGEKINITKLTPDKYVELEAKGKFSGVDPNLKLIENKKQANIKAGMIRPEMLFNLYMSEDLPVNKDKPGKNKLRIKGNIVNFNMDEFKPYVNLYTNHLNFSTFRGKGDIDFDLDLNKEIPGKRKFFIKSRVNDLNIIDANKGKVSSYDGELKILTRGSFNDRDLYLDNFELDGKTINAGIKGKIANFKKKKIRNVDLSLDLNNTRAKTIAEVFPKTVKVTLDPFNKILKHNIDANVSGSLKIKGYYRRPDLFGKIRYNDLSIIEKIPETPNGYGTVGFTGPAIIIDSTQYLGKDKFVKTTGNVVPFKGKKLNLSISSTKNVDFGKALPVLFAIRDIFEFKLYPVTEMDIKGVGKVNLDIKGKFKDVNINGYVEANNATVKYKTLAGQAENVNGRVKFTGERVYYDDVRGVVDGMKVIPSGYSTLHGYSDVKLHIPELDLKKGHEFVYGSPLLYKVQYGLKDIQDVKGTADATIFLKGTDGNPDSKGTFKFKDAYLKYDGYGAPFENLKGQLRYTNQSVFFDDINGNVLGNNVTINGSVNALTKDMNMTISSKNIKLEDAKKFVMDSSVMYKPQDIIKDYTLVNGTAEVNLVLKGNIDGEPLQSLVLNNINATFKHINFELPVKVSQGTIDITPDSVKFQGIKANTANADFTVKGKVSNLKAYITKNAPLIPNLVLKINDIQNLNLKETLKLSSVPVKAKKLLSELSNLNGAADLLLDLDPTGFNATLNFNDFAMIYKPYNLPILLRSGKANITNNNASFYNLYGRISNSDFQLRGFVKNYLKKPFFDFTASVNFNPEDASKLSSKFNQPIEIGGIIPVNANLKGSFDNWSALAKVALDKGVPLRYAKQMGLPEDRVKLVTLDAHGNKNRIDINNLNIDLFNKDGELSYLPSGEFNALGQRDNILHLSGSIDKLKTLKPEFKNFRIVTNKENCISSSILNPLINKIINNGNENFFSNGNIQADLTLNGYILSPEVQGAISFSGLNIPDYKLTLANADVSFAKDGINLDLKDLKIADSIMDVKAMLNYSSELPLMIKNMTITSDYLNIDSIGKIITANKNTEEENTEAPESPYIVIQNGTLNAKELILRDLITSNVKASLSFTPDWLLTLCNIQLEAAGGVGTGNLYYNVNTTDLSFNLNARNMQANALATTLLSLPNEVYGTLNGEGQFYTKGKNSEELISNANGYASFKINDGRLVRLGSLEYLLRASNVLQSGIAGFNINNIIDLIVPQKTGYFNQLEGKFDVKDGVLYTDEIASCGENLSLFISGNLDLLTNYADVKILGKLSKKVSGLLGPLGSVSINEFIGFIPGFGFLPSAPEEKGLIDLIPGLSKIPVIGLSGKQKYRQFVVEINGNLYEQSSVRSFRWIN